MKPSLCLACLGLALSPLASALEAGPATTDAAAPETSSTEDSGEEASSAETPAKDEPSEQEALSAANKLAAEKLAHETSELRAEITRVKMERELITEKLALENAKRRAATEEALAAFEAEKQDISNQGELAKIRAEKLANDLKAVQTEAALEITRLQSEIAHFETAEKRAGFAGSSPVYLENPLKEDGTLVISDRRIPLNGPIVNSTADFITDRIDYWNNKDRKLPIFIVIDTCPGGSVMAGYRILKSMESSEAPIHVVVKSFAASMAACITTLAEESYAYPNAVILHHQISSTLFLARLNLTQQKEFYEESTRWWERLATPVAQKMGISTDEFIKRMYARSTSGDWSEFGDSAKELKWVDHIIQGVEETSLVRDPDTVKKAPSPQTAFTEELDSEGMPVMYLPRLNPKDVYFLYNPDGYYRLR